jgi:hypothetical protein
MASAGGLGIEAVRPRRLVVVDSSTSHRPVEVRLFEVRPFTVRSVELGQIELGSEQLDDILLLEQAASVADADMRAISVAGVSF